MKRILMILTDKGFTDLLLPSLGDTLKIVGPMIVLLLFFILYKYEQRKKMLFDFVKYGMYRGSGQR